MEIKTIPSIPSHGVFLDAKGNPHGVSIDKEGSLAEIPLEDAMPKWLYESLNEEDDDVEIASVVPYLENEFKKWLMDTRDLSEISANRYIEAYMSAYESLYDIVGLDLPHILHSFLVEIPEQTKCDLTISEAPGLVEIYVETMIEELEANEKAYTKAERRALTTYHDFIAEKAGTSDKTLAKKKSNSLPDEEEFLSWLEKEVNIDYENARKIVSSVKRMDLRLPSLVSDPMTFLDVLRALPAGSKRKNYIKMVSKRKKEIYRNADCSDKTIKNGFANIDSYLNFLNSKNTKK